MKTIKSIGYLLTAFLAVQSNFLNAGNPNPVLKSTTSESSCIIYCSLAPVTPKEADFNENETEIFIMKFDYLKPLEPKEATFDETDNNEMKTSWDNLLEKLSPVTPKEADFNEIDDLNIIKDLKPVTPSYADFDEN